MTNNKPHNGYDLSRSWFDHSFENPDKVRPVHSAIYFFAIEHCNRLGWKEKFGFPTTMAMEAIGVKSYNTYISALKDIVEWGFIKMIQKSKNQHSSNIIALSKIDKAPDKALNKALLKHSTKQLQYNKTKNQITINPVIENIFRFWNNQKIIEHRELTNGRIDTITKSLKHFSSDDIKTAIRNYDTCRKGDYFFSYKWNLEEFLSRDGYKNPGKFLEEGTHYENFIRRESRVLALNT